MLIRAGGVAVVATGSSVRRAPRTAVPEGAAATGTGTGTGPIGGCAGTCGASVVAVGPAVGAATATAATGSGVEVVVSSGI